MTFFGEKLNICIFSDTIQSHNDTWHHPLHGDEDGAQWAGSKQSDGKDDKPNHFSQT